MDRCQHGDWRQCEIDGSEGFWSGRRASLLLPLLLLLLMLLRHDGVKCTLAVGGVCAIRTQGRPLSIKPNRLLGGFGAIDRLSAVMSAGRSDEAEKRRRRGEKRPAIIAGLVQERARQEKPTGAASPQRSEVDCGAQEARRRVRVFKVLPKGVKVQEQRPRAHELLGFGACEGSVARNEG